MNRVFGRHFQFLGVLAGLALTFIVLTPMNSRGQSAAVRSIVTPHSINYNLDTPRQTVAPKATTAVPKIAFGSSRENGNHDIYLMDPDGANEARLTTNQAYDDQPAFSPDGSTIAFMTDRDGNFEIYTMPAVGGLPTRITNNFAADGFPAYSPNGQKIAFVRGDLRNPSTFEIWVMNADGSNQVQLTHDTVIDGVPSWSPDGTRIIFMSGGSSVFDPNSFEIYWMQADGSDRIRLTNNNVVDGQPSFNPDNIRIVFASGDAMDPNSIEIYVMSFNGQNITRLTNNNVTDGFPVWSPDGASIIFARGSIADEKTVELWKMNADGTGEVKLTNNTNLDWFPAYQRIIPPPTTIQFGATTYSGAEGNPSLSFTVTRSGNTAGTASVIYSTGDNAGSNPCSATTGIASERCDYETTAGTLTFAPGEISKTVSVTLIDDGFVEGSETFKADLLNASGSGVALGTPATATITIADNDSANSGTNPLDNADALFFVRQHYIDFLNREPDPSGLAFWANQITSCGNDAQCIEIRRINVSAAFFLSIEFQETGYLVYRTYKVAHNPPGIPVPVRYNTNEFIPDTQQISNGVIIGQPGAEQRLEANKQAYFAEFVLRLRFTQDHPTSKTPAQFVDSLYTNAGVNPSASERQFAIAEFGGAANTADTAARARVLRRVTDNATLKQQELNKAFVLMEYFGYLRRNPFDPPELTLDFQGYNFWLNKLNQFNGNFVNAEMVKAFIISAEYRHRFGP